jgi:cell division topological specificity factor
MGLFNFLFSPQRNSAAIAKERLKIVLAHERAGNSAPDFLPKLQKELIEVVARYVAVKEDMIRVNLGKSGETSVLEINVELDGAKPKMIPPRPPRAGLRPPAQPPKPQPAKPG